jgi:nucleotide-binding universal stress UspA family protein
MLDPAVRRIVVGVDGSAESVAALRWACREARLRGVEVHAVHAWEASCRTLASYAASAQARSVDFDALWRSVLPDGIQGVQVRTEVAVGLIARVLLERCAGAEMLVLGTASNEPGTPRSVGPVIRACLRRASCPVVVISTEQEGLPRHGSGIPWAEVHVSASVSAGVGTPAGVR